MRIAVTGSTGLIGAALVGHLKAEGHTVQRLVRRKPTSSDEVQWDPIAGTIDLAALKGVDAIIHLAGAGVGDKRWTTKYRATILNSRLLGTTTIAGAVTTLQPKVFISASAIGFYGETGNRAVVETDRGGDEFLSAVCREWEAAADIAVGVRTIKIRTGLGGKLGSGKQWWSWITLHDEVKAITHCLTADISGPVNLTSPNPVTNQEFTGTLARALHRPALFPVPAFVLKLVIGGFSSEILGSAKVLPKALQDCVFVWDYPHLTTALTALTE
jgi:NAD dependent epimerase/dehydratase family enzyme